MHNAAIRYQGYTLKSKTEFLWARHFQVEGFDWEYEPIRFQEGKDIYIPDFFLDKTTPIEIKVWVATNLENKFYLCPLPLLIIFGTPDRHYVRFKPANTTQIDRGHYRHWSLAYQRAAA